MPNPQTMNRGASVTRSEVKKIIGTVERQHLKFYLGASFKAVVRAVCAGIIEGIDSMASRADKTPGGLGRKYPVKPKGKPKRAPKGQGRG